VKRRSAGDGLQAAGDGKRSSRSSSTPPPRSSART